ncbi:MAG: hypothetical protein RL557_1020 [archaeon]|jgi:2,3-bisphosphoglycerate-dependent phosphoglycerate mutase
MKKRKKFYIYLFRHGQTSYNKNHIFTGWDDPKLTSLGKRQVHTIALRLRSKKIGIAIQTRLSRSGDSLHEVLRFHPECRRILTDDRMIERNYGKLNGVSHDEFIRGMGKQEYDLLKEGDAIGDLSVEKRRRVEKLLGKEEFDAIHRGYSVRPPGGESFKDVEKRVLSFIRDLKKLIAREQANVVISAHGNSIRLFRKIMEGASREQATKWFIPYNRVFVYSVSV